MAFGVDAEDGRIRGIDEQSQIVRYALQLCFACLELSDVLTDTHDTQGLARSVTTSRRVQQHLDTMAALGDEGELEVVCLKALHGFLQHAVHRYLVLIDDEVAHKITASDLLLFVASDVSSFAIPLVDAAMLVSADDGRICVLNEGAQIGGNDLQFITHGFASSDILAHSDDADNLVAVVPAAGRIEQHIDTLAVLGVQRELEVVCLRTLQCVLEHLVDRILEFGGDEVLNERAADDFVIWIAGNLGGLAVPLVDAPVGINTEDGRVGGLDEHFQVTRNL